MHVTGRLERLSQKASSTVTEIPYTDRESVMSALDVKPSAFLGRQIDRACLAGSRLVDGFCHRTFAPTLATKTFDYPGYRSSSQRIWFDQYGLISASTVTSNGASIAPTDYFLRPDNSPGEPFQYIELNRTGSASFSGGPQRAVSITGLWGYADTEVVDTVLAAGMDATQTYADVGTPTGGIGSLLRIGSERLLVTDKSWLDSAITSSALAANNNAQVITTASAASFTPHEKILIDGERMEVLDVAGTAMTVRRAVDGTTLAAHSGGAQIYWQHRLRVERAAAGTTAAAHSLGGAVGRWTPPSQIGALARGYAIDLFLQENAGYARTSGQGENERPVSGAGLKALEARVRPYVRGARSRAV